MSSMFEPVMIGKIEIKNRFVHSATHEAMSADDGSITDDIINRYIKLAKGDIGLIIPGHLYIHPLGKANNNQSGIHSDSMIPGLRKLVKAVHANNGKIAFQLDHGGRQSPRKIIGQAPLAPTNKGIDPVSLNKPIRMGENQILRTIEDFGSAAQRARKAGADAVQLHAGHGFLINEFLSPFFNHRKDSWGGSEVGRFQFLKEIVIKVREELTDDIPVLVKLNANDFTPNTGITPDLAAKYAKWLVELGIASIEVTCGTYYGFQTIRGEIPGAELVRALPFWMRPAARLKMKYQSHSNRFKEAYNLTAAKTIKPFLNGTPLILVGGVRRLDQMEKLVSDGTVDMISMSRPFIREPSLVRRFSKGKAIESSCISCNKCFAAMFNEIPIRCYQKGMS